MITWEACMDAVPGFTDEILSRRMNTHTDLLEAVKRGESCYSDNLGWLNPARWAGEETIGRIESLAAKIRADADVFVIVGVGGSLNAARAVIEALQTDGPKILYMGNTLSPHALEKTLHDLEGKRFYINCIAKNFETLEPGVSLRLLRGALQRQYGIEASKHIIVTGTPGSQLEQMCCRRGYTFLTFPQDIGGRYTALSNVGLFPMAVAGVDVRAVVTGARAMRETLLRQGVTENIALRYACVRQYLYEQGKKIEMLACFEPQYRYFFKWWTQLFAESEGKQGKGLFPVTAEYSEELHSVGQYMQEGAPLMFETFLAIEEPSSMLCVPQADAEDGFGYVSEKPFHIVNEAAFYATRSAHSKRLPCLTLKVQRTDARTFGALFYFFQFACYLSGRMQAVNPFDQPGVEAYKQSMFQALGKQMPLQERVL